MGPRQDEQEQALSEGKKGAGFCTVQVGESASLSSKANFTGRRGETEEERRRTDMKGAIFLFILQGDDGHGKSISKVISPSETERF